MARPQPGQELAAAITREDRRLQGAKGRSGARCGNDQRGPATARCQRPGTMLHSKGVAPLLKQEQPHANSVGINKFVLAVLRVLRSSCQFSTKPPFCFS